MAINDFSTFKDDVRTVLLHLYDPDFEFPADVYTFFNCEFGLGNQVIQEKILSAIAELEPAKDGSFSSRERRYFDSLYLHYNRLMTQEEVANHLHLSVRHLQRTQAEALHLLAGRLWNQHKDSSPTTEMPGQAADWSAQRAQEISLLKENAPDVTADVEVVLRSVLAMDSFIVSAYGILLEIGILQTSLITTVHPSILRQSIISAISSLATLGYIKTLKFYTALEGGRIKITLVGPLANCTSPNTEDLTRQVLVTPEMHMEIVCKNDYIYLNIHAPVVGERSVLVVEDTLIWFISTAVVQLALPITSIISA
jgi:hypothetical protein